MTCRHAHLLLLRRYDTSYILTALAPRLPPSLANEVAPLQIGIKRSHEWQTSNSRMPDKRTRKLWEAIITMRGRTGGAAPSTGLAVRPTVEHPTYSRTRPRIVSTRRFQTTPHDPPLDRSPWTEKAHGIATSTRWEKTPKTVGTLAYIIPRNPNIET